MNLPDVVYPLVKKSQYEELRYSLRSLSNVPHGRVFIAGAKPDWLSDEVIHIPIPKLKGETRYQNAEKNWRTALSHPLLADDFIAMNDDFFIMEPMQTIAHYHDGDLEQYLKWREDQGGTHENYLNAMRTTTDILHERGVETVLGYTLHIPMLMNKYKRLAISMMFADQIAQSQILLMRTIYGNLFGCGGEKHVDVKHHNDEFDPNSPFLSTNDPVFKYEKLGDFIRDKFNEPSKYER